MPRLATRSLVTALTLLALVLLAPTQAAARPQAPAVLAAAERLEAAPGRLAQLWNLLSALWAENGSILDPNGGPGGTSSEPNDEPDATGSGDNGSGLDPNG